VLCDDSGMSKGERVRYAGAPVGELARLRAGCEAGPSRELYVEKKQAARAWLWRLPKEEEDC